MDRLTLNYTCYWIFAPIYCDLNDKPHRSITIQLQVDQLN